MASGAGAPEPEMVLDNANESWARLNADPLLWMKRQEQGKVKSITSNPYLMMQLKQKAHAEKLAKKQDKKDKKERKAAKKSKHRADECASFTSVPELRREYRLHYQWNTVCITYSTAVALLLAAS